MKITNNVILIFSTIVIGLLIWKSKQTAAVNNSLSDSIVSAGVDKVTATGSSNLPASKSEVAKTSFARGLEFVNQGKFIEAKDAFRAVVGIEPTNFKAHYNLGLVAFKLKNYQESLVSYQNALALKPTSTQTRFNLALTLKASGLAQDAIRELETTIKQAPQDNDAHLLLANLYAQDNQSQLARPHYLKVLEENPQSPQKERIRSWLANNP